MYTCAFTYAHAYVYAHTYTASTSSCDTAFQLLRLIRTLALLLMPTRMLMLVLIRIRLLLELPRAGDVAFASNPILLITYKYKLRRCSFCV